MPTPERYELIETIAKGDFATVFRARDRELGREVAIKQIHQQYLDDPAQLERYWQEAQLLASLEHPYIMTIYDIVRSRGWLVLELMKGSLQQQLAGNPIDLEDLRLTMIYTLSALQFLHKNGIIHGDVKPGNLLLDRNSRIKLGDFGIARRIAAGDGSVVKGTTKYMAPEVLSDQFGPVGPHSDIYSLGFSAYELMCGSHFESLFPGLHMFGRDPQVAWMMWHSAPDRRLPEIAKVLEGVPPDLAAVVEKMIEKDPARRYKNADKPLTELRARAEKPAKDEAEAQAAELAKSGAGQRNKRLLLIGALAVSVLLSVAMLFLPTGSNSGDLSNSGGGTTRSEPNAGRLVAIVTDYDPPYIKLQTPNVANPVDVHVAPGVDRFFVNKAAAELADLKPGDELTIKRLQDEQGDLIREIYATRPVLVSAKGTIASLDAGTGMVMISVVGQADPLTIYVPADARVQFNRQTTIAGRQVDLRDLQIDDRIAVEYRSDPQQRLKAASVAAERVVKAQGFVQAINTAAGTLTIRVGEAADGPTRTLPVAPRCVIAINGVTERDGAPLTLGELISDDRITLEHDWQIHRVDALRGLQTSGTVAAVDYEAKTFTIGEAVFSLAPDCRIQAAGIEEPVTLGFLRPGDKVTVSHNSFDLKSPVAAGVDVEPAPDARAWALLIAAPKYSPDAQLVQASLAKYYRVPGGQSMLVESGDSAMIKNKTSAFLGSVAKGAQLIAYVTGDGKLDAGVGYVADGVELDWLLTEIESTVAADRMLLLDTSHAAGQPSAAELAESRHGPGLPVSASVSVLAGSKAGEAGLVHSSGRGLLAHFTAQAFRGEADVEPRDGRVHVAELAAFLDRGMAAFGPAAGPHQSPQLFTPGTIPRLHPEAREGVIQMLSMRDIEGDAYKLVYEKAKAKAPNQPDVLLAHALNLLHKSTDSKTPRAMLVDLRARFPATTTILPASAWTKLTLDDLAAASETQRKAAYLEGMLELAEMVKGLPPARPDSPPYAVSLVRFAGAMRQFALHAAEPRLTEEEIAPLDRLFAGRNDVYSEAYERGKLQVDEELRKLDAAIAGAANQLAKDLVINRRRRLASYQDVDFDARAAAELLRAHLDD
jgi:serine/threonine-protein kinase